MSNCDCCSKYSCRDIAVASSLVVGILAGVLRYNSVISLTSAFLWVVFGIAVGFLAVSFFVSAIDGTSRTKNCDCAVVRNMLAGILGTILLSVVLLAVEFAVTSILGTVIAGGLLFFFALMLTSVVCLIKCHVACSSDGD